EAADLLVAMLTRGLSDQLAGSHLERSAHGVVRHQTTRNLSRKCNSAGKVNQKGGEDMQAHRIYGISVLAVFLFSLTALGARGHPYGSSTDPPDRSCTAAGTRRRNAGAHLPAIDRCATAGRPGLPRNSGLGETSASRPHASDPGGSSSSCLCTAVLLRTRHLLEPRWLGVQSGLIAFSRLRGRFSCYSLDEETAALDGNLPGGVVRSLR